ncbi:hypothetical protein C6497_00745 [Candidatus Poribacteria bacterium]|nr:MAG: hypothetical protein C6497_00745 [Candidatus Poribacteria bacterium]
MCPDVCVALKIIDILGKPEKEWERMTLMVELTFRLNLTDAELSEGLGGIRAETLSESKLYRYANRAMEHLQADGLIENPERGIWRIKP